MRTTLLIIIFTFQMMQAQTWHLTGNKFESDTRGNRFGHSVSLSDDGRTIAFGIPLHIGNNNDTGQVRIYSLSDGNEWLQKGKSIDAKENESLMGYSISLNADGNIIAIGAPGNDEAGFDAGQVRVYYWNKSEWIQKGNDINGEKPRISFGKSLNLSDDGNTVIIGTPDYRSNAPGAGRVKIFSWDGEQWKQKGSDVDGNNLADMLGFSVDLSSDGNTIAAGAPCLIESQISAGYIKIFDWDGEQWKQKGDRLNGDFLNDQFGYSVSLSSDGNTVAIGAELYSSGKGQVKIFSWNGAQWLQKGNNILGESGRNYFGYSVSLSNDGNTLAVGAPGNDGNSYYAGQTKIFDWKHDKWEQKGNSINGDSIENWSGASVSLSTNGNIVAIGAPNSIMLDKSTPFVAVYAYSMINDVGNSIKNNFYLSPNPATDFIEIIIDNHGLLDMAQSIKVYDILGVCVLTHPCHSCESRNINKWDELPNQVGNYGNILQLDVSMLPKGVYFVRIVDRMLKFVKI